ncbi:hypothetical protein [Fodinibius salinus]|nr:hypothetical protein [Fodinibius salinus]
MLTRIVGLCTLVLFILGCSSTQSVYDLSEQTQRGITYQTYKQSSDKAFEAVDDVFTNQLPGLLGGGWEVANSDSRKKTVETEWRVIGSSQSAHEKEFKDDERIKVIARVTEKGKGSQVTFRLKKQRIVVGRPDGEDPWRDWTVKKKDAKQYLQPLFKSLNDDYLTVQTN